MFARSLTAALAAALTLAAAGCGPPVLDEKRSLSVAPGMPRAVDLPAVAKPQTVTVRYDAPAAVNVYVLKTADFGDLNAEIPAAKALAKATGGKAGTLTADVPANTATRVVVDATDRKADVELHVTNKK